MPADYRPSGKKPGTMAQPAPPIAQLSKKQKKKEKKKQKKLLEKQKKEQQQHQHHHGKSWGIPSPPGPMPSDFKYRIPTEI